MKAFASFIFSLVLASAIAQPAAYKPTSPQVVYEMYIDCVEPLHNAYESMSLETNKTHITSKQMENKLRICKTRLEEFHKLRLHRDAYTAASIYLEALTPLNDSILPILAELDSSDAEGSESLMAKIHEITIEEAPLADEYRESIAKVIELFKEEWDVWLEAEVVYFSRLSAQERNSLYESGFGREGLKSVKRRFYTAKYFVVNMNRDVTDKRVETIKATFKDLSALPDFMVNNTEDFIGHVDKVMKQYRYNKTVEDDKTIYTKGSETNFEFVVKRIEVKVVSESSHTLSIKFFY